MPELWKAKYLVSTFIPDPPFFCLLLSFLYIPLVYILSNTSYFTSSMVLLYANNLNISKS